MKSDLGKIVIETDDDDFEERKELKACVRVLAFNLGEETYGISITDAKEVVKPGTITQVPNTPDFVVGVMNLRGEIISIIDLRYFIGLPGKASDKDTSVIVTDITGTLIGMMVNQIKEAVDIEETAIQPPLETVKGEIAEYTKGQARIENDIMVLLDLKKILNSPQIDKLKKGA